MKPCAFIPTPAHSPPGSFFYGSQKPHSARSFPPWHLSRLQEVDSGTTGRARHFKGTAPDPGEAGGWLYWGPASLSMLAMVSNRSDMDGPPRTISEVTMFFPARGPFPLNEDPEGKGGTRHSSPSSQGDYGLGGLTQSH